MAEIVPQIEVAVVGEDKVNISMLRRIKHAGNLAPAFLAIGEAMRNYEQELFMTDGASGGDPWAPLAQSTIETKERKGLDTAIERATHELMDSLIFDDHPDHIEELTPWYFRFGSNREYTAAQQYGTSTQPARPVIQFTEEQVFSFTAVVAHYIKHGDVEMGLFA